MSWDAYVDNLVASPGISKATIIGQNGSLWTPGPSDKIVPITQAEASTLGQMVTNGLKPDVEAETLFAPVGITVGGTKYMFLRDLDSDGKMLTAKKTGAGNLTVGSSTTAIIIAFSDESQGDAARSASVAVEKMVKYLETAGY